MIVTSYKTHKILPNENLYEILDRYLPMLKENTVVAIVSKIVGFCEGRIVKKNSPEQKDELAKRESDYYMPRKYNKYNVMLTINNNVVVASAGIDESNSAGFYSLWPKDPQKSANQIREYLMNKHHLKHLGIIITDSHLSPMRYGVTGTSISHSGFRALNSYVGKADIFGYIMKMEQSNIADSLATAAVTVMGEGSEQQPLAVITEIPFVTFQQRNPTKKELEFLNINLEDDIYISMLSGTKWEKGGGGK